LPEEARQTLSKWFPDLDLSEVRVKTGLPWYVPNENPRTGARNIAYTQGNTLYFEEGYYDPNTASGLSLIGHELTHVRQQNRYGLWTYRRLYLFNSEFAGALEAEAEAMQGLIFRDLRSRGVPR
jgi:hypothetical protein